MRLRLTLLAISVTIICGSVAVAAAAPSPSPRRSSSTPHTGQYAGTGQLSGHVVHNVKFTLHGDTVTDFWLGGIHVFGSTRVYRDSEGHTRFSYDDQHFRVTGLWSHPTEVLGVVARTSDPRTAPRITYSAQLQG